MNTVSNTADGELIFMDAQQRAIPPAIHPQFGDEPGSGGAGGTTDAPGAPDASDTADAPDTANAPDALDTPAVTTNVPPSPPTPPTHHRRHHRRQPRRLGRYPRCHHRRRTPRATTGRTSAPRREDRQIDRGDALGRRAHGLFHRHRVAVEPGRHRSLMHLVAAEQGRYRGLMHLLAAEHGRHQGLSKHGLHTSSATAARPARTRAGRFHWHAGPCAANIRPWTNPEHILGARAAARWRLSRLRRW